jgi:hypothetical protein
VETAVTRSRIRSPSRLCFAGAFVALVLAAGACRLWASRDDFWLDEIVTWDLAGQVSSAWEILTALHWDTNHVLSTWIIFLLGADTHWTVYRLPAVAAGIGTVVLAGLSGLRRSRREGLLAVLLTGSSFLLVQYSSEARGYAYLLLFAMLSFLLMEEASRAPRWWKDLAFGASVVLGFLSQLIFLYVYGALGLWSLWSVVRRRQPWKRVVAAEVRRHLLPALFLPWFYMVFVRHLKHVGGDPSPWSLVAARAMSLTMGGPETGMLVGALSLVAIVVYVTGVIILKRASSDTWVFYAGLPVVTAVVVAASGFELFYVRHFLPNAFFLLLLTTHVLAELSRRGRFGAAAAAVCVAAIVTGNVVHDAALLRWGRGGYQQALAFMRETSRERVVTVGSDHDFRNSTVLSFYERRSAPDAKPLAYIPGMGSWEGPVPEWILVQGEQEAFTPRPSIRDDDGNVYRLAKVFPHSGLSGWHWVLYHRQEVFHDP